MESCIWFNFSGECLEWRERFSFFWLHSRSTAQHLRTELFCFSRFSQRIFLDIPHLLLCYPSTATAKTSYGEMDSLPQTWIFSCHCRSKALLGLALAANPKLCVWSEERMMKEPDFDKREWWLLFSAFLGWFFQIPPGSTELLPGLIRSYWADTGDLLATYTCCNLKLLKDFRAGME